MMTPDNILYRYPLATDRSYPQSGTYSDETFDAIAEGTESIIPMLALVALALTRPVGRAYMATRSAHLQCKALFGAYALWARRECLRNRIPYFPPCLTCAMLTTHGCQARAPREMRNITRELRLETNGAQTVLCGLPLCTLCEDRDEVCIVCARGNVIENEPAVEQFVTGVHILDCGDR